MCIAGEVLSGPLARMYVGYDAELLAMTKRAFFFFSFSFLFCGFSMFGSSFFTALNDGLVSASISALRTCVFQIACVFVLPLLFGLDGIWGALTVSEILSALVVVIFLAANRKKYGY